MIKTMMTTTIEATNFFIIRGSNLKQIVALLEPFRAELTGVVVESTFNWYCLVDGLLAAGFDVKLANTAALPEYSGLKYSGDEHDARHLAHLLRLKLLRMGYIFPPELRAVRDPMRRSIGRPATLLDDSTYLLEG